MSLLYNTIAFGSLTSVVTIILYEVALGTAVHKNEGKMLTPVSSFAGEISIGAKGRVLNTKTSEYELDPLSLNALTLQ